MEYKLIKNYPGIRELKKEELCNIDGGLGGLAVILAVAGICGGAMSYKKFCDSINEMGQKIGAAIAR